MSLTKSELEGGFIQVKKKLWRGVIRTKEDKRVIWTCKHNHSRPEFNSRYEKEEVVKRRNPETGITEEETVEVWGIWETSALNCGRAAYRQWQPDNQKVKGHLGDRSSTSIPIDLRPDTRIARVGDHQYVGTVKLTGHGKRVLSVDGGDKVKGSMNLDLPPKKGLTIPIDLDTDEALKLVTAIWLLKGGIWGVMFQDHRVTMEAKGVIKEAVQQLLEDDDQKGGKTKGLVLPESYAASTKTSTRRSKPAKKLREAEYEPGGKPRIEVRQTGGKRIYEVVDSRGVVLEQFHHRGKATKALEAWR